ncbi:MAG: DUF1553 domain-containing protein [Acidobacteria bacterium]|nr:DUF1553 domain-containing protein [Acidobacteriota bacterium]
MSARMCLRSLLLALFVAAAAGAAGPDFQREIRPVLSDACFHCHGPDPETRMAGLRLDVKDGAFAKRDHGTPIAPGDPAASLVYQRITHEQAALRMPPEYSHKSLKPEQIEKIKQWIEAGAEWSEPWAYRAPERPAPPAVRDQNWPRNPIDSFILAELERNGLAPAPEADRRTLIRRLTLDLTGLPPAPAEVEAFVNDSSPDAYENLVDRLLASPAYGEHRARYWLDAARYADTHGLHIDNYREMWPYRDWVIGAFNQNMPFDQFTVEQLAGDLLPNPTREQLIATGFHRCNVTTNEGGVIDEEVAAMYAKDRVDTTGTVWMGLTVGCATCHDHKFDPIKQKDFYSLAAFFRNTTQEPRDGNIYDTPPIVFVPSAEDEARWDALKTELPAAHDRLDALAQKADPSDWLDSRKRRKLKAGAFDESEAFALDLSKAPRLETPKGRTDLEPAPEVHLVEGPAPGLQALLFPKKTWADVPGVQPLHSGKPFTVAIRFRLDDVEGARTLASQNYFEPDPDKLDDRGWRIEIREGRPQVTMMSAQNQDFGMRAAEKDLIKAGEWRHLTVVYRGGRQREDFSLFLDGERLQVERTGRALRVLEAEIATEQPLVLGAVDREADEDEPDKKSGYLEGAIADFRVLDRAVSDSEAKLLALWDAVETSRGKRADQLSEREREAQSQYYLVRRDAEFEAADRQLTALQTERLDILRRTPVTLIQQEQDSEAFAHILYRGMYDQPREKVEPATPGVLPPMSADLPRNRLGLARWLVDPGNPLTARVTANRFWQELFGKGIVETAEDFGSQGTPPTHPELLDWLAVDFQESGWDVKRLIKTMVMSSTYRQAAAATPDKLDKDPLNKLLSRGPRFRMDGEMVRDYALAAGGLLIEEVGGPSVKPYQPAKIWETVAMYGSNTRFYQRDQGEKLYRRSLYTFWKRSAPNPSMDIFNAPTRESCTVRRERTNTPLQALVTMNDPQFVEAARTLAARTVASADGFDARLDFITERLLARPFEGRERSAVQGSYRQFMRHYDTNPEDARKLLAVGASPPSPGPASEVAAWTMVANQLLNLDEVLNK